MAALTTIHYSSPTSFQLKHGLKCNKKNSSSSSIIHSLRTWNHNHILRRIRCCAVSRKEGKVSGDNSWTNSDTSSSGDVFSGWVDTNSANSKPDKPAGGFGGLVAAGVAGVILATGLTFTSLYLSKRNTSAQKPGMEALSAQQEMLLSSDDQNEDEQVKTTDSTARPDEDFLGNDSSPESMAGIIMDSSSSQEITDATFERRPVDDINVGTSITQNGESASSHTDDTNNTSNQEDKQIRSGSSDVSVPSNSSLSLPKNSESDLFSGHANASSLKDPEVDPADAVPGLITEPKDNLVPNNLDYPPVSDDASAYVSSDFQNEISMSSGTEIFDISTDLSSGSGGLIPNESDDSVKSDLVAMPSWPVDLEEVMETETAFSPQEDHNLSKMVQVPKQVEGNYLNENGSTETNPQLIFSDSYTNEPYMNTELGGSNPYFDSLVPENSITSSGIPAPSLVSAALQVPPGKVVVPAAVDQVQGQALAALQVLKVIEADAQPGDLCTRREYARWLVSASSALSRNSISKVYPAMYIENVTELAFDDITPEDPDFAFIQGLAEAGLISSKLSWTDMLGSSDEEQDPSLFFPESPLSRQDLVSWKMALDKRWLPDVDKKIVYQSCGFIDIDKINPDAWPALVADQSAGEEGIMALAFGYTRLFQPYKPVTKGQAAIALATGEAADIVSEELARIEAESMAETAVAAHSALVAKVEKDINASFEKELIMEREKIDAVEKMAQEARMELERLKAEREEETNSLMRGQAAVESEMQVLSSLRHEVEEQLQSLMSDKMEVSFERERINKLRKEAESENQAITRLQYELEVERKALSMARAWAEDEAKRAREQAKALEEARDRWEKHGIKVIVDDDLREDANAGVTWLTAGTQSTVDATVSRAESLVLKLKTLAGEIRGKSRFVIETIIFKITSLISSLKEWAANSARRAGELHSSLEDWAANSTRRAGELQGAAMSKASASVQELQQGVTGLSSAVKEGAKRVAEDCKDGVEKISQKFKA